MIRYDWWCVKDKTKFIFVGTFLVSEYFTKLTRVPNYYAVKHVFGQTLNVYFEIMQCKIVFD